MKLGALIMTLALGTSGVAVADPGFSAHVTVGMPQRHVVVRDRQFRGIDNRYDRYYDDRDSQVDEGRNSRDGRDYRVGRYHRVANVAGVYNSTLGEVRLTQDGDRVIGTYAGGGTLQGRVVDNKLFFRWTHAGDQGRGVFLINGRGSMQGMWGMDRSNRDGGRWDLQRMRISRR